MHIKVGGVPEHFNLPWRLAIEEGAFSDLDVELEWIDIPEGTGAIMAALAEDEIQLATPLTEGAVTAIANGNPSRMVRVWVDSPLLWGVHAAAASPAESIDDLEGQRFAISRFGSGSELMSRVLAQDFGWNLSDEQWVVVNDLAGARRALSAGDAEIFLWNKSMTQPHVDDGTFKRVGILPTPWPSFAVVAAPGFLDSASGLVAAIVDVAAARAGALHLDPSASVLVGERYGLEVENALEWLAQVAWAQSGTAVDTQMLTEVIDRMASLGRIDNIVTARDILAAEFDR